MSNFTIHTHNQSQALFSVVESAFGRWKFDACRGTCSKELQRNNVAPLARSISAILSSDIHVSLTSTGLEYNVKTDDPLLIILYSCMLNSGVLNKGKVMLTSSYWLLIRTAIPSEFSAAYSFGDMMNESMVSPLYVTVLKSYASRPGNMVDPIHIIC